MLETYAMKRDGWYGTNPLCVHLADVCQALSKSIRGHFVAKLVLELGSLALRSLRKCSGICDGACDNATD